MVQKQEKTYDERLLDRSIRPITLETTLDEESLGDLKYYESNNMELKELENTIKEPKSNSIDELGAIEKEPTLPITHSIEETAPTKVVSEELQQVEDEIYSNAMIMKDAINRTWVRHYQLLISVKNKKMFKPYYKSFSAWLKHLELSNCGTVRYSRLCLSLGEKYNGLKKEHRNLPTLEELNVSADGMRTIFKYAKAHDETTPADLILQYQAGDITISKMREHKKEEVKEETTAAAESNNVPEQSKEQDEQQLVLESPKEKVIEEEPERVKVLKTLGDGEWRVIIDGDQCKYEPFVEKVEDESLGDIAKRFFKKLFHK